MNAQEAFLGSVRHAARKHREDRKWLLRTIVSARAAGASVAQIAEAAGVHRATVYNWLKEAADHE